MEQRKEFHYFVFVSYKREDEKWAKWLQNKLEHYRFPTNLNERTDLPKNIRPTFRDVTDLNPGLLAEEINNALSNSEWLIVICSPRSAKSPWVCKEAQTFIDLGRADHIIPFVIEGNPFSDNAETECYPEALLNLTGSKELLAANINEMGRDAAAIKVVARMFNLRFDSLWQRHEREQKRKRRLVVGGALLFALVSFVIVAIIAMQSQEIKAQRKSAEQARDSLSAAYDSLTWQNGLISQQRNYLQNANDSILWQNGLILQQKNDLQVANDGYRTNLSRALAEKSNLLTEEGDSYLARKIALQALPPNLPGVIEAEMALRKAVLNDNALFRHNDAVTSIAYSPDGIFLATGSSDKVVRIWNTKTGMQIGKPLEGHSGEIKAIAFSPRGNRIVSASNDGIVKFWNLNKMTQEGHDIKGEQGNITSVAFSPTGDTLVTASWGYAAKMWDVRTQQQKNLLGAQVP